MMSAQTAEIVELRVTLPKPRKAQNQVYLVRHDGRLFAFDDLLLHAPEAAFCAAMETSPDEPQCWWDELTRQYPRAAEETIELCPVYGTVEPCRILAFTPPRLLVSKICSYSGSICPGG